MSVFQRQKKSLFKGTTNFGFWAIYIFVLKKDISGKELV